MLSIRARRGNYAAIMISQKMESEAQKLISIKSIKTDACASGAQGQCYLCARKNKRRINVGWERVIKNCNGR